jgi:hypothetical protein
MALQEITIGIPDKVLLAKKTDAQSFGREIDELEGRQHAEAMPCQQ